MMSASDGRGQQEISVESAAADLQEVCAEFEGGVAGPPEVGAEFDGSAAGPPDVVRA